MRVLIVEDDLTIANFLVKGFKEGGFAVDHAADGETGAHMASTVPYDVAIVDLMLPKLDGLSLIQRLRDQRIRTPVIILSAKHTVDDRVKGLESGGDDYLTKPFAFSELFARVQALIRRSSGAADPTRLVVGDLVMDLIARRVSRDGREITLRPREFALLEYLMRNAERVVSKTMILSHVWDYTFDPGTNVVDVLVFRLRDKIDKGFERKMLQTVRESDMFSSPPERQRPALGLRLAIWYAAIFVVSSLTLIAVTYLLLSTSLRQYDREIIETTLVRYATAYRTGGVNGLAAAIRRDQTGPTYEPLFVRAVGPFQDVMYLSPQTEERRYDFSQLDAPAPGEQTWSMLRGSDDSEPLEVASVRLLDGTLFQVGKSTARRELLLRRFRIILLVDFASLVGIGLAGGAAFTASALKPLTNLNATVREILRTGKVQSRVPAGETGDALDQLGIQVNAMLDRIESLIAGMRGALDNVAHDLRTPMMRLRSIAETALQSRGDAAALREALADCLEESDRVVAMLNTLMDISEAETGTMRLHRERVNLTELVAQAVELYEDVAEEKGVTLENQASNEIWVDVDRTRMRQVIANLLDNALKYTPAGGRVEIATRAVNGEALLSLHDTGIGISPDELPRIWERLYRGDKSRSERGLGLGLSLVKAIAEAHRGRVTVESEPEKGSRFVLHLPAAPDLSQL